MCMYERYFFIFFFCNSPPVECFSVPSDLSVDRKVTNLPTPVLHRRDTVMTFKKQREPAKHRPGVFFCSTRRTLYRVKSDVTCKNNKILRRRAATIYHYNVHVGTTAGAAATANTRIVIIIIYYATRVCSDIVFLSFGKRNLVELIDIFCET